jgi:hypothetical protein
VPGAASVVRPITPAVELRFARNRWGGRVPRGSVRQAGLSGSRAQETVSEGKDCRGDGKIMLGSDNGKFPELSKIACSATRTVPPLRPGSSLGNDSGRPVGSRFREEGDVGASHPRGSRARKKVGGTTGKIGRLRQNQVIGCDRLLRWGVLLRLGECSCWVRREHWADPRFDDGAVLDLHLQASKCPGAPCSDAAPVRQKGTRLGNVGVSARARCAVGAPARVTGQNGRVSVQ